jgi:hypothetical protein
MVKDKSNKGKKTDRIRQKNRRDTSRETRRKQPLTLRAKKDKEKNYRNTLKQKHEEDNAAAIEELKRKHEEEEAEDMRELNIGQNLRYPVAAIPDDLTVEKMRSQIKAQEEIVKRQKEEEEEELMLASLNDALKTPVNSPIRDDDGVAPYNYIKYGIESPIPKSSPKIRSLPNSPERLPPLPIQKALMDIDSPKGGKQRKSKRKTSKKRSKKRNTRRRRKN